MEHNKDRMVFTVTAYNKTVTIDVSDDLMIYDFLDHCRDLALAMGYDMNTWKTGVIEMAEYYLEETDEAEKGERLLIEALQGKHKLGHTAEDAQYVRKEQKVYTGKSDEITHWGPLDKPVM